MNIKQRFKEALDNVPDDINCDEIPELAREQIMNSKPIKTFKAIEEDRDEPVFDSPDNSKWIMSVSDNGTLTILSFPNIHDSFLEIGTFPEEFGLPESVGEATGVYEVMCSFSESTDFESGIVDDWTFEIESMKPLWLAYKEED